MHNIQTHNSHTFTIICAQVYPQQVARAGFGDSEIFHLEPNRRRYVDTKSVDRDGERVGRDGRDARASAGQRSLRQLPRGEPAGQG